MMLARDPASRAIGVLILDHPFFATGLLRLRREWTSKIATAATDGRSLWINPDHWAGLSLDEQVFLLAHEVLHPMLQHHTRRGNRPQNQWNVACDYAANAILVEGGLTPIKGALYDAAFSGKSAEEIYRLLNPPTPPDAMQRKGGEQGQGGDQGQGQSDQGQDQDQSGQGQPGSGPPSNAPADPTGCGSVLDAPAGDEAELADIAREWVEIAATATAVAKSQGKLPGECEQAIREELYPSADWRQLLRRFMETTAREDYSWARPNRRHIANGLYLPGMRSDSLPAIVIGLDTSGSVSDLEIAQLLAEVDDVLQLNPANCWMIQCDARIRDVRNYQPGDTLERGVKGRGGTRFAPVFDWVEEEGLRPACLIYLTDLECDFPDEPDYPVMWASTTSRVAPWGETIEVAA